MEIFSKKKATTRVARRFALATGVPLLAFFVSVFSDLSDNAKIVVILSATLYAGLDKILSEWPEIKKELTPKK